MVIIAVMCLHIAYLRVPPLELNHSLNLGELVIRGSSMFSFCDNTNVRKYRLRRIDVIADTQLSCIILCELISKLELVDSRQSLICQHRHRWLRIRTKKE